MAERECTYPGCGKVAKLTRGYCPTHYMRVLRNGTPDAGRGWKQRPRPKQSDHRMYPAWQQMILRCHDPKNSVYPRYGARGIYVCDRWREAFVNFLEDMGERPDGMTLDRIDPTGPYSPDNCRWATVKEQRANLSADGDARVRAATSAAKKAYWRKWRQERGLPPDPPTKAEYRARSKKQEL